MNDISLSSINLSQYSCGEHSEFYLKLIQTKEQEYQKTINQLNQKVQLLEIQNKEMQDREENIKKINDQIMSAVNNISSESDKDSKRLQKEHNLLTNTLKKDNEEYTKRLKDICEHFENEIAKYKEKQQELDLENSQLKESLTQKEQEHQININLMSQQSEKISQLLKQGEDERKRIELLLKNEYENQIQGLKNELNKQLSDYEHYRNQYNKDAETNIESIKQLHQHEIHLLTTKINGLNSERNVFLKSNEQNLVLYEELKRRYQEEKENIIKELEKTRQDLQNSESARNEMEANIKYYQTIKDQHDQILKSKDEFHEEDKKKLKQLIVELQQKQFFWRQQNVSIKKQEQREKQQIQALKEKDKQQEELKNETKKQLCNEKRKVEQLVEAANKIKEDYQKRNAFVIQEILNKEKTIKKLNYQLSRQRKQLSTSKLNFTNITGNDNIPPESVRQGQQQASNQQLAFVNDNNNNNFFGNEIFSQEYVQEAKPMIPFSSSSASKSQSQQLSGNNNIRNLNNVQMSLDLSNNVNNPFSPKNFPFINIVSPVSTGSNLKVASYNQFLMNTNLNEVLTPTPEQQLSQLEFNFQSEEDILAQTSRPESVSKRIDDQILSVRSQKQPLDISVSQRYAQNQKSLNPKKNLKVNRSQTIFLQQSKEITPISNQFNYDNNDKVTSSFDTLNFNQLSVNQSAFNNQIEAQLNNCQNKSHQQQQQPTAINKLRGLVKVQSALSNTFQKTTNQVKLQNLETSQEKMGQQDQLEQLQIQQSQLEPDANENLLTPISVNVLDNLALIKYPDLKQANQEMQQKVKPAANYQGKQQLPQNQKLIKNCEINLNYQPQQPEISVQSARNSSLPKSKSYYLFDGKQKLEECNQKSCQDENKNITNYKCKSREKYQQFKKKQQ